MISRIISFLLVVGFTVALHVIHEYLLCGVFAVFAGMHLMIIGATLADPDIFT